MLQRLADAGLVKGKTVGIDATTLEANAALRSIVRRDTGESYQEFLTKLAQASGIETPTRADLARIDRKRKKKGSNDDWTHPHDPDAKITKMKDGRTHLAHKAEHAVDLETGAIVGVTVQDADDGDTETSIETLINAAEQIEVGAARRRRPARGRRRQGLSQQSVARRSRSRGRPELHLGTRSRATQLEEEARRARRGLSQSPAHSRPAGPAAAAASRRALGGIHRRPDARNPPRRRACQPRTASSEMRGKTHQRPMVVAGTMWQAIAHVLNSVRPCRCPNRGDRVEKRCGRSPALLQRFVIIALLLLATGPIAVAQTNTGEIGGVVRDSSGGVLPGATVTATHPASGTVVERVTDAEGRFFLPALRIGQWEITAEVLGLRRTDAAGSGSKSAARCTSTSRSASRASPSRSRSTSACPLLQTTTAEISDVIENREVVQLPLNGRNFLALAQLSDAVVIPPGGTRGEALQQAGPLPNVGGQRSGHNIYLLDGTKVTDELFNNLVINPSVDSIEEFKIQKSMYPAEFGGKASALINVATRAGSNAFRGSAVRVPPQRRVRFAELLPAGRTSRCRRCGRTSSAARSAGRSSQNRTFFFGSYEGTADAAVADAHVLGADRRPCAPATSPASAPICDPLTIPTTGVCTPFANNQIPAEPHRSDRGGVAAERAAADVGRGAPEPRRRSRNRTATSISSACASITG